MCTALILDCELQSWYFTFVWICKFYSLNHLSFLYNYVYAGSQCGICQYHSTAVQPIRKVGFYIRYA